MIFQKKCKYGHSYDMRFDRCPVCDHVEGEVLQDQVREMEKDLDKKE